MRSDSTPVWILFPGLGADGSMFAMLRSDKFEIRSPPLPEPDEGETLVRYATRVAEVLEAGALPGIHSGDWTQALIGGASFGGMLATELARQKGASRLLLLGSTISPTRIPRALWLAERFGRYLPDCALRLGMYLGKKALCLGRGLQNESRTVFVNMGRQITPQQIKRTARMIFSWPGYSEAPCKCLHLHGTRDAIIHPPEYTFYPLERAGHVFVLTEPERTVALLEKLMMEIEL